MRGVCDNDGIWFDYPLTWFITQAAYHKYETLGIRTNTLENEQGKYIHGIQIHQWITSLLLGTSSTR